MEIIENGNSENCVNSGLTVPVWAKPTNVVLSA